MSEQTKTRIIEILNKNISDITEEDKLLFTEINTLDKLQEVKKITQDSEKLNILLPENIKPLIEITPISDEELNNIETYINILKKETLTEEEIQTIQNIPTDIISLINPSHLKYINNPTIFINDIQLHYIAKKIYTSNIELLNKYNITNEEDFLKVLISINNGQYIPNINQNMYLDEEFLNMLDNEYTPSNEDYNEIDKFTIENLNSMNINMIYYHLLNRISTNVPISDNLINYIISNIDNILIKEPLMINILPIDKITDNILNIAIENGYSISSITPNNILNNPDFINRIINIKGTNFFKEITFLPLSTLEQVKTNIVNIIKQSCLTKEDVISFAQETLYQSGLLENPIIIKELLNNDISPLIIDFIPKPILDTNKDIIDIAIEKGYIPDFNINNKVLDPSTILNIINHNKDQLTLINNYIITLIQEDKLELNNELFEYIISNIYRNNNIDLDNKIEYITTKNIDYLKIFINITKKGYIIDKVKDESLLTKEIIDLAIENNYSLTKDSPNIIKTNIDYIKSLIYQKHATILDYIPEEMLSDEIITLAIENDYILTKESPDIVKNNPNYFKIFLEHNILSAVSHIEAGALTDDNIRLCISKGIKFQDFLKEEARTVIASNPDFIKFYLEQGEITILNYAKEESITEDVIITYINKGYKLEDCNKEVFKNAISKSEYCIKSFLLNGNITVLKIIPEITIKNLILNKEELLKLYDIINNNEVPLEYKLFAYQKYIKSQEKDTELDAKYQKLEQIIKLELIRTFQDTDIISRYIEKIKNGNTNPLNYEYIKTPKDLIFVINYGDIKSTRASELNAGLTYEILNKVNKNHISKIINSLRELGISEDYIPLLAINMYITIGHDRAQNLLKNQYGQINEDILKKLFENIIPSNVLFEQKNNTYEPILNNQLLNTIFGENAKVKNTPIRNILNECADKKEQIEKKKETIRNDLSLTAEERKRRIDKCDEELSKYQDLLKDFLKKASIAFNNWDIIEEEFFKKKNKSSLSIKLNLETILEICKTIEIMNKVQDLEPRDEVLVDSGVFDYALYDTKYVTEVDKVANRLITLSRRMDTISSKKFPNVTLSNGKYTIKVYNPQDRRILSAGYRSGCCFRANGNADNGGNDNSLLNYCVSTEYGGGVEIFDDKGNTMMFSPILRNGNVLMIHSIETSIQSKLPRECYELLQSFSKEIIEQANQNNDDISFVTITDLHYLDLKYTSGTLPLDKKFSVYEQNNSFAGMYNNLSCNHMILASKQGKKTDDIYYGPVSKSYEYEELKLIKTVQITDEEKQITNELEILHHIYITLVNQRTEALKNGNEQEAYDLLRKIKLSKLEYLKKYEELTSKRKNQDLFSDYTKAINTITSINEQLNEQIDTSTIQEITYSNDWYIIITTNNELIARCLESGINDLSIKQESILQTRSFTKIDSNINSFNKESSIKL